MKTSLHLNHRDDAEFELTEWAGDGGAYYTLTVGYRNRDVVIFLSPVQLAEVESEILRRGSNKPVEVAH